MNPRRISGGLFALAFGASLVLFSGCDLSGPDGAKEASLSVQALQCPPETTIENAMNVCALVDKGGTLVFADSTFPLMRLDWSADGEHALYVKISWRKSDGEDLCSASVVEEDYCFVRGLAGQWPKGNYSRFFNLADIAFDSIPHWYVWQVYDGVGPAAKVLAADTSMFNIKLIVGADSVKSGI